MKLSKAQICAMHLIKAKFKTSAIYHEGAWWVDMGKLVRTNTLQSLERKGIINLKSFQVDIYKWVNAGYFGTRKIRVKKNRNLVRLQQDK